MSWQETLEQAQNTIFCKEIYNQVNLDCFIYLKLFLSLKVLIIIHL